MTEAGVAGAEVVEREAGALLLQFISDAAGVFGVADEGAFGDLEDKALEGKFRVFCGGADMPWEREVGQLSEGDIDGEGEMLRDVFGSGENGAEEIAGEQAVEAGLFGQGNELIRRDEAPLRMLPSGQSFEAAEKAGAQFDERLKIRDDLVIFERSAQIIRVVGSHGSDDTTVTTTYTAKFCIFQRATRSRAAAGQKGKVN